MFWLVIPQGGETNTKTKHTVILLTCTVTSDEADSMERKECGPNCRQTDEYTEDQTESKLLSVAVQICYKQLTKGRTENINKPTLGEANQRT